LESEDIKEKHLAAINSIRAQIPPKQGTASMIAITLWTTFEGVSMAVIDACQCLFDKIPPVNVRLANKASLKV
jgi:hypothetical protein